MIPLAQNKGQSSFILYVFFPLCWIPRHSPKVVKAASQVLNSMWQYRDLRSLYKKVKSACCVLWLYQHCVTDWKLCNDNITVRHLDYFDGLICHLFFSFHLASLCPFLRPLFSSSGWLFSVPFCQLFLHDRERQTATLFFLSYSVHFSCTDLPQQSIRWVHPPPPFFCLPFCPPSLFPSVKSSQTNAISIQLKPVLTFTLRRLPTNYSAVKWNPCTVPPKKVSALALLKLVFDYYEIKIQYFCTHIYFIKNMLNNNVFPWAYSWLDCLRAWKLNVFSTTCVVHEPNVSCPSWDF